MCLALAWVGVPRLAGSEPSRAHYPIQAVDELDWQPEYGLVEGLKDSWDKDFNRGTYRKEADFSTGERCSHAWGQKSSAASVDCYVWVAMTQLRCGPALGCQPWHDSCHDMQVTCYMLLVDCCCTLTCGGASGTDGDVPLPLQMTWSWRRSSSPRWHDDQRLQYGVLLASLSPRIT